MSKIIGLAAGFVVFGFWMSIVGNPHVVETVIGMLLGAGAGIWAWRQSERIGKKFGGDKGA